MFLIIVYKTGGYVYKHFYFIREKLVHNGRIYWEFNTHQLYGGGSVQGVFMTPPVGKYKTSYIMADFQVLGAELIINNYDKI